MAEDENATLPDEEAAKLFEAAKDKDPLPFIPPALLNSSDTHEYITRTGLLAPYDQAKLKSSSYEVQIGDEAIYWNDNGEKTHRTLEQGEEISLEPNSLIFFKTKQKFRLPPYIAIRFNLRITNVHRGLLLGTGPLVDPGFEGHLLIPLHNFTTNTYRFRGGEDFIWVEFTKISPNTKWHEFDNNLYNKFTDYVKFPDKEKEYSC